MAEVKTSTSLATPDSSHAATSPAQKIADFVELSGAKARHSVAELTTTVEARVQHVADLVDHKVADARAVLDLESRVERSPIAAVCAAFALGACCALVTRRDTDPGDGGVRLRLRHWALLGLVGAIARPKIALAAEHYIASIVKKQQTNEAAAVLG